MFDHITIPHHRSTATFEDLGDGRTKVSFRLIFETAEKKRWTEETFKAEIGLKQTMIRMVDYVAGMK